MFKKYDLIRRNRLLFAYVSSLVLTDSGLYIIRTGSAMNLTFNPNAAFTASQRAGVRARQVAINKMIEFQSTINPQNVKSLSEQRGSLFLSYSEITDIAIGKNNAFQRANEGNDFPRLTIQTTNGTYSFTPWERTIREAEQIVAEIKETMS